MEAGAGAFAAAIPLFVLLIASFNVANILLARMASRRREIAVRFALGARRLRLIRQLLTEGVLLALSGCLFGLMVATWVSQWSAAQGLPAQFSPAVLFCVLAVTVGIGLGVSWLPALRATRADLVSDLKEGGGSPAGGIERHRLRNFLVTGQIAMALVLCVAAGLLVRSYLNKKRFDPGFEAKNFLFLGVYPGDSVYDTPQKRFLYCDQVLERLRAVAGLEEVSVASTMPVNRHPFPIGFKLEGDSTEWKQGQSVNLSIVSPNYLDMVNLPVLRGRPLTDADRRGAEPVVLVNQAFVNRFFPHADPIGRQFEVNLEGQPQWLTMVGIVPDRRNIGFKEDLGPEAFVSYRQAAPEWVSYVFLVGTRGVSAAFSGALREAVRSVDRNQPVAQPVIVKAHLQWAIRRNLEGTQAVSVIGLFGLIMAALGIYGMVSYSIVERTHEVGVRMALGAGQLDVIRLILKQGMTLTLIGIGVGILLALGVTFGISQLLFGVRPVDPATYLVVCGVLTAAAFLASLIPARRATKIDPIVALRYE